MKADHAWVKRMDEKSELHDVLIDIESIIAQNANYKN